MTFRTIINGAPVVKGATTVTNALADQDELAELNDVVIDSPAVGEALVYDGEDWKNQKITIDPTPQIFMLMGG
jgi:hypothetical protein